MKKTIFLFIVALGVLAGCKTQKDLEIKSAEKIAKEAQEEITFQKSVKAITNQDFAIEADRINIKGGRSIYVNSNTNFISLKDNKAVIQLAFNTPQSGPNGIGGITVQGSVSNIKTSTDKKGNVSFSMSVIGIGVSANVFFTLVKGTNQVTATVTPNFNSNRITFTGYLYPSSESNIFKGRPL